MRIACPGLWKAVSDAGGGSRHLGDESTRRDARRKYPVMATASGPGPASADDLRHPANGKSPAPRKPGCVWQSRCPGPVEAGATGAVTTHEPNGPCSPRPATARATATAGPKAARRTVTGNERSRAANRDGLRTATGCEPRRPTNRDGQRTVTGNEP